MTLTMEKTERLPETELGKDLDHFFCGICDPDGTISFCGLDLNDAEPIELAWHVECVVCDKTRVCPRCGDDFSDEYDENDEPIQGFELTGVVFDEVKEWMRTYASNIQ